MLGIKLRLISILAKHSLIELQPSLLHFLKFYMYEYLAYMSVYVPSANLVPREIEMGVASLEREIKTVGSNHVGEC